MEASRLVFVYVRDAKPKRKVAVPVPDGYTWGEFIQQVKLKLKITGVKEISHASTGQKVTGLDELQDIDELCVVEGAETVYMNGNAPGSEAVLRAGSATSTSAEINPQNGVANRQQFMSPDRFKVVVADGQGSSSRHDDEGKYRGRVHPLKRTLQRLLPSLFAPTLPVTAKDAAGDSNEAGSGRSMRRKRGRRSMLTLRNILLLLAVACCFGTMVWFFFKSAKLSGVS
eukprot:CAMPEP_0202902934 /NCGR_PEP_ID=MMETSP1392-20130828/19005_1 /ASSEMBLY_ACC=CAM_ASM_000868 /TAXON_ID=225041 /ORGANISM="Chlamydomonas chlamydogama, Strain SAG 11-48b" /LENGTH=227 /DNA_ID=CAMNT_0049589797 /DNA_START=216 /DNA_END=899 /DNA_ORIENTATION=+